MEHHNGSHTSNAENTPSEETSPPSGKRLRAKQACEPCRLRKRRCDGQNPCNMCHQFEYKCYFEKHPRKRSKLVQHDAEAHSQPEPLKRSSSDLAVKPEPPKEDRPSLEDTTKLKSMEANSGIAFTRLLGLRLDPSSGPKLFTFGWNLGSCSYSVPQIPPITSYLAAQQMFILARLYFDHVHPLYGFLDEDWVIEQLSLRWSSPNACTITDHMLANIAAVGTLFSDGSLNVVLPQLVNISNLALVETSIKQPPSLVDVQSWVLRCLYLRATDSPHAVWMATCSTMHLIESVGIHQESSNTALHPPADEHLYDPELRRRTFWIARMLNTWVSFEYGRTRVALRGINCQLPTPSDGDYTTDFINLYSLSCFLEPERSSQAAQWEDFLRQLDEYKARHDGIMLSKANLTLCGYRRMRLASPNPSIETMNRIISIGLSGLESARRMAKDNKPWWHVANVPFQVICVFLAMDTRESLVHISEAMRTLEYVVGHFNTVAMQEALKTARFLVRLSKKRKDEDSTVLGDSLKKDPADDPHPANLHKPQLPLPQLNGMMPMPVAEPRTTASSEDWSMDILNDSDFDWNYFLTADMPAFNNFAPDGTM